MQYIEKGITPLGFPYEVEVENDTWNGTYREYFKNSNVIRTIGSYKQDRRSGKFESYSNDENHSLIGEDFYNGGKDPETRKQFSYFIDGKIKSIRTISASVDEELFYNESSELINKMDYKNLKPIRKSFRNSRFGDVREKMMDFVEKNYDLDSATVLAIDSVNSEGEVIKSFNEARLSQDLKHKVSGKGTGERAHHNGYLLKSYYIAVNFEFLLGFGTNVDEDRKELQEIIDKNKKAKFLYIRRVE